MQTLWFQHLPSKEQEEFKSLVLSSHKVLDRLREIVYNKIKSGEMSRKTDYDNPSWPYLQADKNGEQRAYKEMLDLLTFNSDNELPKTSKDPETV